MAKGEIFFSCDPAVLSAIRDWQSWLLGERRASPHTLESYSRDLAGFLAFLTGHLGGPPSFADLGSLKPADFRSYLAHRIGAGTKRTSVARALSVLRGFFRFLERTGRVANAALAAVKTPDRKSVV